MVNYRVNLTPAQKQKRGDLIVNIFDPKKLAKFSKIFSLKFCLIFTNFFYTPGQPNWEYTMWKFEDFSATQSFREINFGHFEAPKTAILTI